VVFNQVRCYRDVSSISMAEEWTFSCRFIDAVSDCGALSLKDIDQPLQLARPEIEDWGE